MEFLFFSVTGCAETVAFGPSILNHNPVNCPTSFIIQAKDKAGNNRVCGMDRFRVEILHLGNEESQVQNNKSEQSAIKFDLVDNNNGTYEVKYTPLVEGSYSITV